MAPNLLLRRPVQPIDLHPEAAYHELDLGESKSHIQLQDILRPAHTSEPETPELAGAPSIQTPTHSTVALSGPRDEPVRDDVESVPLLYSIVGPSDLKYHDTKEPSNKTAAVDTEEIKGPLTNTITRPIWKPWPYHYLYFILLISIHIAQIVMLEIVAHYNLKDSNRPDDVKNFLVFGSDQAGAYFTWQYLPMIIAVGLGVLWETIDVTVRRLEPFYQLSRPGWVDIKDSLSMDYVTAFNFFVPFQAARNRHWAVALSSLIYLINFGLLPTLTGQLLVIAWDTEGKGFVVLSPGVIRGMQAVLGLTIALAIGLWVMLHRRSSGLIADPSGIGGVASLISQSNVVRYFQPLRSYEKQAVIDSTLRDVRFSLGYSEGQYQIIAHAPDSSRTMHIPPPFVQIRSEAHSVWLWGRTQIIIGLTLYVPTLIVRLAINQTGKIPPRVVKGFYTLSAVYGTAMWSIWQREVSLLEPYTQLNKRRKILPGSSDALHLDFMASSSLSVLFKSIRKRCFLVAYISFCSFITHATTILFPVVFDNAYAIIFDEQQGDVSNDVYSSIILTTFNIAIWITYPLGAVLFIGWVLMMCARRKPFLPRKPLTLSSTILYLCNSTKLLEDFAHTSSLTSREREAAVGSMGWRYGFGWVMGRSESREWNVGIEQEPLPHAYKYGQIAPNIAP